MASTFERTGRLQRKIDFHVWSDAAGWTYKSTTCWSRTLAEAIINFDPASACTGRGVAGAGKVFHVGETKYLARFAAT